jgi:hypothetical protein
MQNFLTLQQFLKTPPLSPKYVIVPGPSEAAYLKLSPSEAEFGSKSSELSRVEFAFRAGQKLPPLPPSF